MKKLLIFVVITSVIVSGVFGMGYISKHMKHGVRMAEKNLLRGFFLLKMRDELGLSPNQVKKIEKINLSFQESVIKRMSETKILELKLAAYLQGDNIARKTVEKMIRNISKQKSDLQVDRIFHLLDVRDILTPEQLKKAMNMRKQFHGRKFRRGKRKNN